MTQAMDKFVSRIERIAEYYKIHGMEADYQDLKNALDEYYKDI